MLKQSQPQQVVLVIAASWGHARTSRLNQGGDRQSYGGHAAEIASAIGGDHPIPDR
jgi:hypothetical protein